MDTLVIDLETKKSFADVGGKQNIGDLGISVAGVYSYAANAFHAFEEHELGVLAKMLEKTGHIIGFNIKQFDLLVLAPYVAAPALAHLAITDMYEDATNFLGHRVGLDALARTTLGESKSGHGMEALDWFRQGKIEDVKKYCLDDVRLTRDLYEYGKKHHHVLFQSKNDGKIHSIPVQWGGEVKRPIASVIGEALAERKRLRIEYISSQDSDGMGFQKSRLIDVYALKPNGEVEAYCHLRKAIREFRLNRILSAELTPESYELPHDAQAVLFS